MNPPKKGCNGRSGSDTVRPEHFIWQAQFQKTYFQFLQPANQVVIKMEIRKLTFKERGKKN